MTHASTAPPTNDTEHSQPDHEAAQQPCTNTTDHRDPLHVTTAHKNQPPSSAISAATTPPPMPPPTQPPPTAATTEKKAKKPAPSPGELNNMIQSKICQLETETTLEEEEEKAMAKSIRKANKEFKELVHSNHEDQSAKYAMIHQKYMDLFQDMKRLKRENAKMKRKQEASDKEKETAKSEIQKSLSMKTKLESLCRQLQKENKRIKDESKNLATMEQEKREELSTKFESTIWEIKNKMEEDTDEKKRRMDDSEILREKFQSFLEQYELREQHFLCVLKSKDLELRLAEAKLSKQQHLSEQKDLKVEGTQSQITILSRTETELRKQLGIYVDKFRQVEDTLNKSNELFTTFRKEMEEMTKKTKRLERDNSSLRQKCDTMNRKVLEMAEEQTKSRNTAESLQKRKTKLENLCRALQGERGIMKKQIERYEEANGVKILVDEDARGADEDGRVTPGSDIVDTEKRTDEKMQETSENVDHQKKDRKLPPPPPPPIQRDSSYEHHTPMVKSKQPSFPKAKCPIANASVSPVHSEAHCAAGKTAA